MIEILGKLIENSGAPWFIVLPFLLLITLFVYSTVGRHWKSKARNLDAQTNISLSDQIQKIIDRNIDDLMRLEESEKKTANLIKLLETNEEENIKLRNRIKESNTNMEKLIEECERKLHELDAPTEEIKAIVNKGEEK